MWTYDAACIGAPGGNVADDVEGHSLAHGPQVTYSGLPGLRNCRIKKPQYTIWASGAGTT